MNLYLSQSEEARVRQVADDFGVTMAYVLRVALRRMLGLPIDEFAENLYRRVFDGSAAIDQTGHVQSLTGAG